MILRADFHNHSCLSPCGSLDLSPRVLVERAVARGIDVLALSDHNTARNTPPFEALCRRAGILPLCGLEVTTVEELHCLCLFETSALALEFGALIEAHQIRVPNRPDRWGDQPVVDEDEQIVGEVEWWLGTATDFELSELGRRCLAAGGLFIPAHIDRASQSIKSQLGYLPDLPYSALEVRQDPGGLDPRGKTLVRGSDAHYPDDVGRRTCRVEVTEPSFAGLREALAQGRVDQGS